MKVETADNGPDRVTGACWRWWCLWWCLLVVVVCLSGDYKRRVVCHRVMHFSRRVWGKGGGGVALIVWMWVIGCAGICLLLPSFLAASSFRGHPLRQTSCLSQRMATKCSSTAIDCLARQSAIVCLSRRLCLSEVSLDGWEHILLLSWGCVGTTEPQFSMKGNDWISQ